MKTARKRRHTGPLAPNPELWCAFEYGPGLRRVLEDFYTRAFADPLLAPFFHGVDREWVTGKQYSFLSDIFSGSRLYFGARPRNAHHAMVIDDALFDHRESVFEDCLRRYGLAEHLIVHVRRVDEVFRKHIVKSAPRPMKIDGAEVPLCGVEPMVATMDMLCDACHGEIPAATRAYHVIDSGQLHCAQCHQATPGAEATRD